MRHDLSRQLRSVVLFVIVVSLTMACGNTSGSRPQPSSTTPPITACESGPNSSLVVGHDLSVDAAQQLVPFTLIVPSTLPPGLVLHGVNVEHPSASTAPSSGTPGPAAPVWAHIRLCGRTDLNAVVDITETTEHVGTPGAAQMQQTLLNSSANPNAKLPRPTQATVSINGVPILRTVIYAPNGATIYTYSWNPGGIHIDVSCLTTKAVSAAAVKAVVSSMTSQ